MRWAQKVFIQKTLAYFPESLGDKIYLFLQRSFGGLKNYKVEEKLNQGFQLLEALQSLDETLTGKKCLEIGSGWVPVIPVLFWVRGMESCYLYDQTRLLYGPLVTEALRQFSAFFENHPEKMALSENRCKAIKKLLNSGLQPLDVLAAMNLIYRAPADVRNTGLPAASLDYIFSNTTLEHIPGSDIREIFKESARILKPGGLMIHLIDLSDHFSHQDKDISFLNFLKYSEKEFGNYNNRFCYQNRLRSGDYRQLFEEAGFEIKYWEPGIDEDFRSKLPQVLRDEAFRNLTDDELLIRSICVAARKK